MMTMLDVNAEIIRNLQIEIDEPLLALVLGVGR
jgi:hypothetical protein